MKKILFLHNTAMWYRLPFFKGISRIFDVKFIFDDIESTKIRHGVDAAALINQVNELQYQIVKKRGIVSLAFFRALWQTESDIIVDSFGSYEVIFSYVMAKIMRKPLILWSEEWGWARENSIRERITIPLKRYIISHTDAILVPGSKHKEYFVSLCGQPEKIFLMPNASNVRESDYPPGLRDDLLHHPGIQGKKVVLYVGRLKERKGIQYLLRAFAELARDMNNVVLLIVGTGEYEENLRELAITYNIDQRTFFAGHVPDQLLPHYYRSCSVCVIPSITCKIGDPWVFIVNEAMTFGKPVIASDAVGAAYDMISDGVNGYMVPEKDSERLCRAIQAILSDDQREREMGVASKRIITEGFQYHHMIAGFEKAISYVNP